MICVRQSFLSFLRCSERGDPPRGAAHERRTQLSLASSSSRKLGVALDIIFLSPPSTSHPVSQSVSDCYCWLVVNAGEQLLVQLSSQRVRVLRGYRSGPPPPPFHPFFSRTLISSRSISSHSHLPPPRHRNPSPPFRNCPRSREGEEEGRKGEEEGREWSDITSPP